MSGMVDSHVHLWDVRHTPQPWMTQEHAAIARPFGPGDLKPLLERQRIDAAIVVQGACLDSDTDYLFAEADRNDWIAGRMYAIDIQYTVYEGELTRERQAVGFAPGGRGNGEEKQWTMTR